MVKNQMLARGIPLYGRAKAFKRSGKWKFSKKGGEKKVVKEDQQPEKTSRYYDADDIPKPLPSRKHKKKPTKLKANITPGTVLIILAGRFRGKRAVFLKQLEKSGLLLVSGPYKINGVPLRRINQAYCIGTSTKVDISGVTIPEHINDDYFARVDVEGDEGEEGMLEKKPKVNKEWLEKRKADQKTVDTGLLKAVSEVPMLRKYLNAKFTLTKGQAPHDMVF